MTLKNMRALTLIAVVLLLGGCTASTKMVSEWQADKTDIERRDRIAVVAMMPEALQRLTVEQEIVDVLRKSGRNALVSSDIPGMAGRLTRNVAEPALRAASVQALIVVFLTDGQKGEKQERADYYTKLEGTGFYASSYPWFEPQFANVYTLKKGTGFFDQDTYVFAESTYFDIADDRPKWSMVTRSKDLETQDAALEVAKQIASKMKSTGTM